MNEQCKPLIDFDGIFDRQLAKYMRENAGKYSEKEWETLIPKLYDKFGDTAVKSAGTTPRAYYKNMDGGELVFTLVRHFIEDVPVSDFLCREIEARECPQELVALLEGKNISSLARALGRGDEEEGRKALSALSGTKGTQFAIQLINLAGPDPAAFGAYFSIIANENGRAEYDSEVKDTAAEMLKTNADGAKERALGRYRAGSEEEKEYMLEILSRTRSRDEAVFDILLKAFRASDGEEVPARASYLAAYGDERALPVLLEYIDRDDIDYLQFQELRYAIEALGGTYDKERDFSEDRYYREIMEQSALPAEFEPSKKSDA